MEDCRKMRCDGKRLSQVHICCLSLIRVLGLLLGHAHSVVKAIPSGRLYKIVFCIVKGWFNSWLVGQLDSWLVGSVISCSYLTETSS